MCGEIGPNIRIERIITDHGNVLWEVSSKVKETGLALFETRDRAVLWVRDMKELLKQGGLW